MQGPYVYALYESYGYKPQAIGQLFIAGFGSSLLFGTIAGALADKACVLVICVCRCCVVAWCLFLGLVVWSVEQAGCAHTTRRALCVMNALSHARHRHTATHNNTAPPPKKPHKNKKQKPAGGATPASRTS